MCLPYTIDQLRSALSELDQPRQELAGVQAALIQSEKLASMGQLSAAIAHEINNPLGVVLMYTHILHDECPAENHARIFDPFFTTKSSGKGPVWAWPSATASLKCTGETSR